MKTNCLSLLLALTVGATSFAQFSSKEHIKVEILKSKPVDNVSVFGIRPLQVTSDKLRKVIVKTKIESTPENKTKLSAFRF